MSLRLNTCKKQQASRDGRHQFWRQFRKALYDGFEAADRVASPELTSAFGKAHWELNHWTSLDVSLFESLEGRDVNYRQRIQTQLGVVCLSFFSTIREIGMSIIDTSKLYSLISQRDSREQINQARIAKEAKQDGADMKYFAYIGSFFLPANFVAVSWRTRFHCLRLISVARRCSQSINSSS